MFAVASFIEILFTMVLFAKCYFHAEMHEITDVL
jgi:hypothetical protein